MKTTAAPFLWFDDGAEEAVAFYVSLFDDGEILEVQHLPVGEDQFVSTIDFQLGGTKFVVMNAHRAPAPNEAFSFSILCEDQAEVDRLWDALVAEGEPIQCSWLKDKYGFHWQIVPKCMHEYMKSRNEAQRLAVMQSMMKMVKMDAQLLKEAYESAASS